MISRLNHYWWFLEKSETRDRGQARFNPQCCIESFVYVSVLWNFFPEIALGHDTVSAYIIFIYLVLTVTSASYINWFFLGKALGDGPKNSRIRVDDHIWMQCSIFLFFESVCSNFSVDSSSTQQSFEALFKFLEWSEIERLMGHQGGQTFVYSVTLIRSFDCYKSTSHSFLIARSFNPYSWTFKTITERIFFNRNSTKKLMTS